MSTGFINLFPDGNISEIFNPSTFVSTSFQIPQIEATSITVTSTSQTNGIIDFGTVECNNLTIENTAYFTGPIIPNSNCLATTSYIDTAVTNLIDGSSEQLNTLRELSQALNDDANFGTNVVNQLATKANDSLVVHNFGDETIQGNKSFTGTTTLNNITFTGLVNEIEPQTFNHLSDVTAPIQGQIDDLNSAVTNLSTNKADLSYVDLQDQALNSTMVIMNTNLINSINTVNTTLTNSINDNVAILDASIESNVNTLNTTINTLNTNLQNQINTKAEKAYVDGIKTVTDNELLNLNTNKANLTYVNTQDQQLQTNIDTLQTNTQNELTNLSTIKANKSYVDTADQLLQTNINTINSNIQGQILTLQSADASLEDQIADLSNIKANITYVDTKIADLVGSSPELMNTLAEISNSLNNDPNFNTTLLNELALKSNTTYVDGQNTVLQSQINTINSTKSNITYVDGIKNELQTNIGTLNTALSNQITNLNSYVDTQDATLQTQINTLSNTKANISYVDSTKIDLQNSINTVNTNLQNQITTVSNNLTSTQTTLESSILSASNNLQSQITSLTASKADLNYVDQSISNLVGLAPENLNTLQELSNAIENDANFSVTLVNQISTKANKSYVDTEVASLQSQINDRALITNVNNSLNEKVNVSDYTTAINSINSTLNTKANSTYVDTELSKKVNSTDYNTAINSINSSLDTKALNTDLINGLSAKVNQSDYITAISNINTSLLSKASTTDVTNAITSMKNEILGGVGPAYDTLNELAIGLQSNTDLATTLTNSLASKANISYVDSSISTAISNIPPTDLTNYTTKTYVDNAVANVSVDLTGYATETFVNTAISNIPATDLTNYATKTYVDTAVSNVSGGGNVDLTGYATETFVNTAISNIPPTDLMNYSTKTYTDNAVATVKNEILGGVGPAYDTLTELKTYIETSDNSVSTALATQIATKANDADVVHLTGTETIGGLKTFSNNVTVSSLNGMSSTTLGYLSTVTAPIQNALNNKANNASVVNLTTDQTIGGLKTFSSNVTVPSLNNITSTTLGYLDATSSIQTQLNNRALTSDAVNLSSAQTIGTSATKTWNNINNFSRLIEQVQALTVTTNAFTFDFSTSSVGYCTPSSATNMTCSITNLPFSTYSGSSFTITVIINASTNKNYVTTVNVNGSAQTVRFAGGSANITVASAIYIIQTITVLVLPGTSTIGGVLSAVTQWY